MGDNDFDREGGGGYDRRDHTPKRCPVKVLVRSKRTSCTGVVQDGRLISVGDHLCPSCNAERCDQLNKQNEDKKRK